MSENNYRADIDGLRAIAVSMVLIFHAFPSFLSGGFIGVDIFFVISGFLIGGILIDQNISGVFSYSEFYAKRIKRLFPALSVVLSVALFIGFFALPPSDYERLGEHVVSAVAFVINIKLMSESGYFDVESTLKPLLHLWSLGVAEQFYILFPVLVSLFASKKLCFIRVILLATILSFLIGILWLYDSPHKAFFHPAARFWELFIGVLVGVWARNVPIGLSLKMANSAAILGVLLICAALAFSREENFPGWWAILPVSGAALLIGPGKNSSINHVLLSNRVLVQIGLISYPLYLWHWPLLSFATIHQAGQLSVGVATAVLLISLALAWGTWRFIEKPLRHGNINATRYLIIIILLIGASGFLIEKSHGVSQRYPEPIQAIIAQDYDGKSEARAGSCFMKTEQKYEDFSKECYSPKGQPTNRKILLWGDSHAAHLYPGLSQLSKERSFSLMQLTASGCPPIHGVIIDNRPACADINDFVIKKIGTERPEIVVMGGYWSQYKGENGWNNIDASHFQKTVRLLHQAGVKKIVLVGQVPIWIRPQPEVIISLWNEKKQIFDFTNQDLDMSSLDINRKLRDSVEGMSVDFVSPTEVFCKAKSCMTFSSNTRKESVAFDYGHLTKSASLIIAGKIFLKISGEN